MPEVQTHTVGAAARITGLSPRRLRNHLAGLPARARCSGEWRRLAPLDLFNIAVTDAVMAAGMTRGAARQQVDQIVTRLFWPCEPARVPMAGIAARCTGQVIAVMTADNRSSAAIDLFEIASTLLHRSNAFNADRT